MSLLILRREYGAVYPLGVVIDWLGPRGSGAGSRTGWTGVNAWSGRCGSRCDLVPRVTRSALFGNATLRACCAAGDVRRSPIAVDPPRALSHTAPRTQRPAPSLDEICNRFRPWQPPVIWELAGDSTRRRPGCRSSDPASRSVPISRETSYESLKRVSLGAGKNCADEGSCPQPVWSPVEHRHRMSTSAARLSRCERGRRLHPCERHTRARRRWRIAIAETAFRLR